MSDSPQASHTKMLLVLGVLVSDALLWGVLTENDIYRAVRQQRPHHPGDPTVSTCLQTLFKNGIVSVHWQTLPQTDIQVRVYKLRVVLAHPLHGYF